MQYLDSNDNSYIWRLKSDILKPDMPRDYKSDLSFGI